MTLTFYFIISMRTISSVIKRERERHNGPNNACPNYAPFEGSKNAGYLKAFFLGGRWIKNQRKSNSVWYNTLHWKVIELICCARRLPNVLQLTSVICQHCSVKTSTVTPSFYYVFKISLSCENSMPSFIGNLRRVLLPGHYGWCSLATES